MKVKKIIIASTHHVTHTNQDIAKEHKQKKSLSNSVLKVSSGVYFLCLNLSLSISEHNLFLQEFFWNNLVGTLQEYLVVRDTNVIIIDQLWLFIASSSNNRNIEHESEVSWHIVAFAFLRPPCLEYRWPFTSC